MIDPAGHRDEVADVLLRDGRISALGKPGSFEVPPDVVRREVKGKVVVSGPSLAVLGTLVGAVLPTSPPFRR